MKIHNTFAIIILSILAISIMNVYANEPIIINDEDPYFCEDIDNPNWVWNLEQLQNGLLIVENDFVMNDASDNPAGEGESYNLPNDYAKISFDKQTDFTATVSIQDKEDNVLDYAEVSPGDSLTNDGMSNVFRLDIDSLLVLGTDSPTIENAETSNEDEYGDNFFLEVERAKIKSTSFIRSSDDVYTAKVLGENLKFRFNDEDSITLIGKAPNCN